MKSISRIFHQLCDLFGVDIRLKRNLRRHKELESLNRWRSKWDPLIREHGIQTILDIGSHTGQFAEMIRVGNPTVKLICFEPLSDSFAKLQQTCKRIGFAECHHVALGAQDGSMDMNVSAFRPSSSLRTMLDLHKREWPASADHRTETISIRRLDGLIASDLIAYPLAIKIDVQGYEDQVLAGAANVVSKASLVVLETSFHPLYDGQPLFDSMYRQMSDMGFVYGGAMDTSRSKNGGKILQEDALFIRREKF